MKVYANDGKSLATRVAWLLAPAILAVMIALNPLNRPTYLMGDFRAFYCAGSVVTHGANPYLEEPLRSCEAAAGPPAEPAFLQPVALPAPLPPYALLLFVPFAWLPFPLAALVYGAILIAAMTAAVALFARLSGASTLWLNLAFAAITATVTYYVGQPVPIVFLALAGAALSLRHGRWVGAAACAAAASIEPHLALPALAGMLLAMPRTRLPVLAFGCILALASVAAVGPQTSIAYLRDVVPAHALANAYEWQFSLTSILTSLGMAASPAVHWGELMYAMTVTIGVAAAYRLWRATGDRAVLIIVPPAFAVFGGVHVHFQQLAVAFPAMLYVYARYPRIRTAAATGITLAMIPWNVISSSLLTGFTPILVGGFAAVTLGQRRGLVLTVIAAFIAMSLLILAVAGFGPPVAHFVAPRFPADSLAETSWGEFSRAVLARPSPLMQWLRLPTLVGLAMGLFAIGRAAFGESAVWRAEVPATVAVAP